MEKVRETDRIIVEITFPSKVSIKERQRIIASIEDLLAKATSVESLEIGS